MSNDIDTELFELCKKVYAIIGAKDFDGLWFRYSPVTEQFSPVNHAVGSICPLYISDYLLEKLPKELTKDRIIYYLTLSAKYGDEFKANYVSPTGYLYLFLEPEADTPLESLLQLTIALHKHEINL